MPDYETVTVLDLPDAPNPTRHKKEIDEAVGATSFGCNYYVAAPGEQLPWGYHEHPDHEELLYVIAGELTVETADESHHVTAGQAMYIGRDSPNRARAVGNEPAHVIAVGAPKDTDGAVIHEECPACGAVTDRTYESRDGEYLLSCADCGAQVDRLTPGPDE